MADGRERNQNGHAVDADALAWTALLAHWTEYAQAAKALPADANGKRWSGAVPHVIALQALTHALAEIARVPPADRALARDRAAIQIRAAAAGVSALWRGEPMPASLLALVEGAERAWRASAYPGLTEVVWLGPHEMVMPAVHGPGAPEEPGGTLLMLAPGTIALPGEPVAIFAERPRPGIDGTEERPARELVQLYRTFDAAGKWTGTFRHAVDDELPAGMPMLVPYWVQGQRVGGPAQPLEAWIRVQREAGIGASRGPTGADC